MTDLFRVLASLMSLSHGWPDDQETDLSTKRFGIGVTEELLEE